MITREEWAADEVDRGEGPKSGAAAVEAFQVSRKSRAAAVDGFQVTRNSRTAAVER